MALFKPRKLRVLYSVDKPDGSTVDFDIRLGENGLLEDVPEEGPAWTRLGGKRCPGCNTPGGYCRAALAITPAVEAFIDTDSLAQVRTRVSMPNYTAEVICPVPKVVSSIMGLTMAASGCSTMAPFRAMAIYHQPFSTLEETVIRAAGYVLLGRWARGGLAAENPFAPLIDAWERVEDVNARIGRSLSEYCAGDATLNGLANLDVFAKAGVFGLESALTALKPALLAWDIGLPTANR